MSKDMVNLLMKIKMEENKTNGNLSKESTPKVNKLTYEQLEMVCGQLRETVNNLNNQLQANNMFNAFKRLDYLFEVLKAKDIFKEYGKYEFIQKCVDEVVDTLNIDEPSVEPEETTTE